MKKEETIIANSPIGEKSLKRAEKILAKIHKKTEKGIKEGKGPFYAEIYDENGRFIAGASNSVIEEGCSICHAEVNALKKAHLIYREYNLAPKNLTIYVNAEPCMMCLGAIMWSGVRTVFYSVPSSDVERITGFDEGFKPDWLREFKKRGIMVFGNIEAEAGKKVLEKYVALGKEIYKPSNC